MPQASKFRARPLEASDDLGISIVKCASELFATHGFDKVSTRDIADRVGVKQATLYYYFQSKQDIYRAAVVRATDMVSDQLIEALRTPGPPEGQVRAFFRTAILVFCAPTCESRVVDRELMNHGEGDAVFVEETTRRPHQALTEVIRQIAPYCAAERYAFFFFSLAYGARKQRTLQLQLKGLEDLNEPADMAEALADWALSVLHTAGRGSAETASEAQEAAIVAENNRLRKLVVDLSLRLADGQTGNSRNG